MDNVQIMIEPCILWRGWENLYNFRFGGTSFTLPPLRARILWTLKVSHLYLLWTRASRKNLQIKVFLHKISFQKMCSVLTNRRPTWGKFRPITDLRGKFWPIIDLGGIWKNSELYSWSKYDIYEVPPWHLSAPPSFFSPSSFWIQMLKKYKENIKNMKKIQRNMKKIWGNMKELWRNMKEYEGYE